VREPGGRLEAGSRREYRGCRGIDGQDLDPPRGLAIAELIAQPVAEPIALAISIAEPIAEPIAQPQPLRRLLAFAIDRKPAVSQACCSIPDAPLPEGS
jgi:hypothetical protein